MTQHDTHDTNKKSHVPIFYCIFSVYIFKNSQNKKIFIKSKVYSLSPSKRNGYILLFLSKFAWYHFMLDLWNWVVAMLLWKKIKRQNALTTTKTKKNALQNFCSHRPFFTIWFIYIFYLWAQNLRIKVNKNFRTNCNVINV